MRILELALLELVHDLTTNEEASDLAGTSTDLVKLGITEETTSGEIVDVTVATEGLDSLKSDLGSSLSSGEDDTSAVLTRDLTGIHSASDGVDVGAVGLERGVHVSHLALHELEVADGLTELLAVTHVRESNIHSSLHDTEGTRSKNETLRIEAGHEDLGTLTLLTEDVLSGDLAVLEDELGGVGAAHTELIKVGAVGETLHAALDDEGGDTLGASVGVGLGVHNEGVGVGTVSDPHLVTVEDVLVTLLAGVETKGNDIGTGVGLRHSEGTDLMAGDEVREVLSLLGSSTVTHDLVHAKVGVSTIRKGNGSRGTRELLNDDGVLEIAKVKTTELLRSGRTEETHLTKLGPQPEGELVGLVDIRSDGSDDTLSELTDSLTKLGLLGGEVGDSINFLVHDERRHHALVGAHNGLGSHSNILGNTAEHLQIDGENSSKLANLKTITRRSYTSA